MQTPTQTFTIDSSPPGDGIQTNWGPGTKVLLGKDPFEIAQFDPSKIAAPAGQTAQLYRVDLSLQYKFINTVQMDFIDKAVATVTSQGIMHLTIDGVHVGDSNTDAVGTPGFFTQKTLSYPDQLMVPHYLDVPKVVSGIAAAGYLDAKTLAIFTGTGTVEAPVTAMASSSYMSSSGNGAGGSSTFASATLSVTYYYQFVTVPEPTSFGLMGLGIVGLCVAARVHHRRKSLEAA
jgi:hypothetical protein